jgi:adenylate kinase family enzyme
LPRHQGQLSWLEDLISLELVINLICPEKIAIKRILANLDGERLGREDDREEVIARRYRLYQERTEPLINYFRKGKIPVMDLMVGQKTTPEMLWRQIQSSSFFWQIL